MLEDRVSFKQSLSVFSAQNQIFYSNSFWLTASFKVLLIEIKWTPVHTNKLALYYSEKNMIYEKFIHLEVYIMTFPVGQKMENSVTDERRKLFSFPG